MVCALAIARVKHQIDSVLVKNIEKKIFVIVLYMFQTMTLKVKKLDTKAKLPEYAKLGDAAMDVYATSVKFEENYVEYGTGLSFEVPEGYVMLIFPRSSVSTKDMMLANSVGVLDSGYRGELKLRFNIVCEPGKLKRDYYNPGDKIGQIMILPYPLVTCMEVSELSETQRGAGGFGSTGN